MIASDLTGPKSLIRLVDPQNESTVALLRVEELDDLQKRHPVRDGHLVLQGDDALVPLRWEARRLLSSVLREDQELPVRVEALAVPVMSDGAVGRGPS